MVQSRTRVANANASIMAGLKVKLVTVSSVERPIPTMEEIKSYHRKTKFYLAVHFLRSLCTL